MLGGSAAFAPRRGQIQRGDRRSRPGQQFPQIAQPLAVPQPELDAAVPDGPVVAVAAKDVAVIGLDGQPTGSIGGDAIEEPGSPNDAGGAGGVGEMFRGGRAVRSPNAVASRPSE